MKKILLILFSCLVYCHTFAQKPYIKYVFEVAKSGTSFQKWESRDISATPVTGIGYTFFMNKNIGIRLTYHINNHEAPKDARQKARYYPPNSDSLYSYFRYVTNRSIDCVDLLATYRLNHKRHSLHSSLGLSLRTDNYIEARSEPNLFYGTSYNNYRVQTLGYSLSVSYQYRIFRNFGVSAEGVFRSSKNIPNTLTYGIRFSYLIWNKRKDKESAQK